MLLAIYLLFIIGATAQNDNSESESNAEKSKNGIIAGTVFGALFLILFPCTLLLFWKSEFGRNFVSATVYINFILSLWALCVLWVNLFPELVEINNWQKTTFTTVSINSNPYDCCEIVNCQCQNYNGPSCYDMANSIQEGSCQNGYFCCNCNAGCGGLSGGCENCDCYNAVQFQLCQTVCGVCYTPTLTVSFYNQNDVQVTGKISTQCSMNDVTCSSYFNGYGPDGNTFTGYYNPYNNDELALSISYDAGPLAAFLIPMIGLAIVTLIVLIITIYKLVDYFLVDKFSICVYEFKTFIHKFKRNNEPKPKSNIELP